MSTGTVSIKIFLFGKARDLSGKREARLCVETSISVEKLLNEIVAEYSLQDIKKNLVLALNEEYLKTEREITLKENDTVAVIPPLSGGNFEFCLLIITKLCTYMRLNPQGNRMCSFFFIKHKHSLISVCMNIGDVDEL